MCIGLWSLEHPDYALILCANRDEYLSRPTANAHFHSFGTGPDGSYVLSGRDLQAGGSWFGINRVGRVALLTNISEPDAGPYKNSRGLLVSSFLLPGAPDANHFTDLLEVEGTSDFAGFNVLVGEPTSGGEPGTFSYEVSLIANSGGHGAMTKRTLLPEERRLGGVSNGVDTVGGRSWPKVQKGMTKLTELLFEDHAKLSEDELVEQLFGILSWKSEPTPANRFQLRATIEIPPFRMSSNLSPDAASADGHGTYGTRLATILLISRDGRVLFIERDIWKVNDEGKVIRGDPREARVFRFRLDSLAQH